MLKDRLTAPFARPRGIPGRLAARLMERGNAEANRWAVDLLGLTTSDRFLDVGCGPGMAVRHAATRSPALAIGIDPAPVMVAHATAVADAHEAGAPMEFKVAPADNIPYHDGEFTAATTVNSAMLWDSPEAGFREIRRVLAPGGRLVMALRERNEEAAPFSPARFAGVPSDDIDAVIRAMTSAGFANSAPLHATFGAERYVAVTAAADG